MKVVVFEGPTKAGKSTAVRSAYLRLREAGSNALDLDDRLKLDRLALAIRDITHPAAGPIESSEELFLYSIRLARKSAFIRAAYEEKAYSIVLVDRFSLSLEVYFKSIRKLSLEVVRPVLALATGGIKPDFTILLHASLDAVLQREGNRPRSRKNQSLENYYEEYRRAFLQRASILGRRQISLDTSDLSQDEVADFAVTTINAL